MNENALPRPALRALLCLMAAVALAFCLHPGLAQALVSSDGAYEYSLDSADQATIGRYLGSDEELDLPASLDGHEVVAIADEAFRYNPSITAVSIPASVQTVGMCSFEGCSSLASVSMTGGVQKIGDGAFHLCTSLKTVQLSEDLEIIGIAAFQGCSSLTKVTFPSTLTELNNSAFADCASLTYVRVPASLAFISSNAFDSCGSSLVMYGPRGCTASAWAQRAGVTYRADPTLTFNTRGGSAVASQAVEYGTSPVVPQEPTRDGYVFAGWYTDAALLRAYDFGPMTENATVYAKWVAEYETTALDEGVEVSSYNGHAPNLTVPDELSGQAVVSIGDNAFRNNTSLVAVTLPDALTTIGDRAFSGCTDLAKVHVSAALEHIGAKAFYNCSKVVLYGPAECYAKTWADANGVTYVVEGTVRFVSNCDEDVPSQTVAAGGYAQEPSPAPAKVNFVLDGWYTDEALTKPYSFKDTPVVGDIVLYAGWASAFEVREVSGGVEIVGYKGADTVLDIPETIDGKSVLAIGTQAFAGDADLSRVTVPSGVASIGAGAFKGCASLAEVSLPQELESVGEGAFEGCASLRSVELPDSLTSIGARAFFGCAALAQAALPDGLTSLGEEAFSGCASLAKVVLPSGITAVPARTFAGCTSFTLVEVPETVTTLGAGAFSGCTSLSAVRVEASLASIADDAFAGCDPDLALNGPARCYAQTWAQAKGVAYVPDHVFVSFQTNGGSEVAERQVVYGSAVGTLTSPEKAGYTFAGWYADQQLSQEFDPAQALLTDTALYAKWSCDFTYDVLADGTVSVTGYVGSSTNTAIAIPAQIEGGQVVSIAAGSFRSTSFTSVEIPAGVTSIGAGAFQGCTSLTSVSLPEGVAAIGAGAFQGCTSLASISLPAGVASIGTGAFQGCASLTSANVPEGVTSIAWRTFQGCTSLTQVSLPSSLASIAGEAFEGCSALSELRIPASLTRMGQDALAGYNDALTLYGPRVSVARTWAQAKGVAYVPDTVLLAFDTCGGSEVAGVEVPYGTSAGTLPTPSKTGCDFVGWFTDAACTQTFDPASVLTQDTQLHAAWRTSTCTVTFVSNGGSEVATQSVAYGSTAAVPPYPTWESHTFCGWYTDPSCTTSYLFRMPVTQNLTLYALWEADEYTVTFYVGDEVFHTQAVTWGNAVQAPETPQRDGFTFLGWYTKDGAPYTFGEALYADLALHAEWEATLPASFADVPEGSWFHSWVTQASSLGLMTGYKNHDGSYTGYFGPEDAITRAQVATVLWRMAGSPSAADGGVFPDVPAGEFYSIAVSWCASQGIVTGYQGGANAGYFKPDANVTREELAVMVWRFAGKPAEGVSTDAFERCIDCDSVSSWAHDAMVWCAAAGILTGKDTSEGLRLDPAWGTTRAQAAKVFVVAHDLPQGEGQGSQDGEEPADAPAEQAAASEQAEETDDVTYDEVPTFDDVA